MQVLQEAARRRHAVRPQELRLPAVGYRHRFPDSDTGRLERGLIQRHGEDLALGRSLLRSSHDLWQLRPLQPPSRHSC
ncbi:hypothetical protein TNCV_519661 [Trichonephila clavipes]|nr:hypothetical protein TNCV_519661 [Trichonephila clavipes]